MADGSGKKFDFSAAPTGGVSLGGGSGVGKASPLKRIGNMLALAPGEPEEEMVRKRELKFVTKLSKLLAGAHSQGDRIVIQAGMDHVQTWQLLRSYIRHQQMMTPSLNTSRLLNSSDDSAIESARRSGHLENHIPVSSFLSI
jgi:hypothetical protein